MRCALRDGRDEGASGALTLRAVLIGLAGGLAIAAGGYINDSVLGLTPLVGAGLVALALVLTLWSAALERHPEPLGQSA